MELMQTPLFNFAADLHAAPGTWANRPNLRGDAYYSFQQIVEDCVERRLPLVLGGDVIDVVKPDARTIAVICRLCDQMKAAGLPIYYIQGQHELNRESPWLSVHDWPVHLHMQSAYICGLKLFGIDWHPRGQLQPLLAQVPADTTFLVVHVVWDEFMRIGNTDATFQDLPPVPWVLSGDYHVTQIVPGVHANGQPFTVVSPGSTCLQAVNEPSEKYFMTLQHQRDGGLSAAPQRLDTRRVYSLDIMTEEALAMLKARAAELSGNRGNHMPHAPVVLPILRIRYLESLPNVYREIIDAVGPEDRLFLEPVKAEMLETVVDYDAQPVGAFDGLCNAVRTLAAADAEAADDVVRLLQSPDQPAELGRMFAAYDAAERANDGCA